MRGLAGEFGNDWLQSDFLPSGRDGTRGKQLGFLVEKTRPPGDLADTHTAADPDIACSGQTCDNITIEALDGGQRWRFYRGMEGYDPNEFAEISFDGPGVLTLSVDTELYYDTLKPSWSEDTLSGRILPEDFSVPGGRQTLVWQSDGATEGNGWVGVYVLERITTTKTTTPYIGVQYFHLAEEGTDTCDRGITPPLEFCEFAGGYALHLLNRLPQDFNLSEDNLSSAPAGCSIRTEDTWNIHYNVNSEGQGSASFALVCTKEIMQPLCTGNPCHLISIAESAPGGRLWSIVHTPASYRPGEDVSITLAGPGLLIVSANLDPKANDTDYLRLLDQRGMTLATWAGFTAPDATESQVLLPNGTNLLLWRSASTWEDGSWSLTLEIYEQEALSLLQPLLAGAGVTLLLCSFAGRQCCRVANLVRPSKPLPAREFPLARAARLMADPFALMNEDNTIDIPDSWTDFAPKRLDDGELGAVPSALAPPEVSARLQARGSAADAHDKQVRQMVMDVLGEDYYTRRDDW